MKNKKLQVFISSTYIDLIDERQAAVSAVLDAGHIPAGMELFKAGNRTQLETIYKWIDDSDVYMIILGGRYGSIEEDSGKSYTHLEYEYAINSGIPVFAVVLNENFLNKKAELLGDERVYETRNLEKHQEFKLIVMSKIVRVVDDSKDIKLAIHTTLKDFLDEYDLSGWVRNNDSEVNVTLLSQINDLNVKNKKLKEEYGNLKDKLEQLEFTFSEQLAFEGNYIEIEGTYEENVSNYAGRPSYKERGFKKDISWDEMFLLWAPRMIKTLNYESAKRELQYSMENFMGKYVTIDDNKFNIIKMQYFALGLINVYSSETTRGGISEFISLTKKGKNYMIQNIAVQKG